ANESRPAPRMTYWLYWPSVSRSSGYRERTRTPACPWRTTGDRAKPLEAAAKFSHPAPTSISANGSSKIHGGSAHRRCVARATAVDMAERLGWLVSMVDCSSIVPFFESVAVSPWVLPLDATVPHGSLHHTRLTLPVTGRRPAVAIRFKQIRKRAAVTWTGWLGAPT